MPRPYRRAVPGSAREAAASHGPPGATGMPTLPTPPSASSSQTSAFSPDCLAPSGHDIVAPAWLTIPALQAVRPAAAGMEPMTRTTELKPDEKRHRRVAATIYVVVIVA